MSSKSTVEEMNQKSEIRIPWGQGIVGYVGKSGTPLNIEDCYADARFNQEIDAMTGYKTRSMMCHPIKVKCHLYENRTLGLKVSFEIICFFVNHFS